jgi:hypothetical protein
MYYNKARCGFLGGGVSDIVSGLGRNKDNDEGGVFYVIICTDITVHSYSDYFAPYFIVF